jgi:hypothetical protein
MHRALVSDASADRISRQRDGGEKDEENEKCFHGETG